MAGDWIPMRLDLDEDPAVIEMAEALAIPEQCVVGYLHKIWSWASRNCNDGSVTGVTLQSLGRVTKCERVPELMAKVGWLDVSESNGRPVITFPNWERWNSQSAKRRALTARRVSKHRTEKCNAPSVTESLPEKRREENNIQPPISPLGDSSFDRFWEVYPKKAYRDRAERAFEATDGVADPETIITAARAFAESPLAKSAKCPTAATWLRSARWNDHPSEWNVEVQRSADDYYAEAQREAQRTREAYCRGQRDGGGLDEVDENWRQRLAGGTACDSSE